MFSVSECRLNIPVPFFSCAERGDEEIETVDKKQADNDTDAFALATLATLLKSKKTTV